MEEEQARRVPQTHGALALDGPTQPNSGRPGFGCLLPLSSINETKGFETAGWEEVFNTGINIRVKILSPFGGTRVPVPFLRNTIKPQGSAFKMNGKKKAACGKMWHYF